MPTDVPSVPVSPTEIAAEALHAVEAGAAELHVHPRGPGGQESLRPADVAACLVAVREAVPGIPVGIGTGAWISPGARARHDDIARWTTRPDYASVNLGEEDALDVMTLLRDNGVAVEAGLWSTRDAERFAAAAHPAPCRRILVEMPDTDPHDALAEADRVLAVLARTGTDLPVLLHGEGRSAWACIRRAAAQGLETRVGLEDVAHLPDGRPAAGNADLVVAASRILTDRAGAA